MSETGMLAVHFVLGVWMIAFGICYVRDAEKRQRRHVAWRDQHPGPKALRFLTRLDRKYVASSTYLMTLKSSGYMAIVMGLGLLLLVFLVLTHVAK